MTSRSKMNTSRSKMNTTSRSKMNTSRSKLNTTSKTDIVQSMHSIISKTESHLERHYEAEEAVLKQLLNLENQFRDHYALMQKELQIQKELTDRLWVLSQRYMILISTGVCCKYADIYSAPAEDVIVAEYNDKLRQLNLSNCHIMKSLHALRASCRIFEELCTQLDMTVQSNFILGDTFHKPIAFFIELVSDLFKYFHAWVLKLKCGARQVEPSTCQGLEEYKIYMVQSEDFYEYLMVGLTYCRCLRPKQTCAQLKKK